MTCIIAVDGVMAADERIAGYHLGTCIKLFAVRDPERGPMILGTAGDAVVGSAFEDWANGGFRDKHRTKIAKLFDGIDVGFAGIELSQTGIALWEYPFFRIPLTSERYGIGTGSAYALGAYSVCGDIERAFQIAHEYDEYTSAKCIRMSLADLAKTTRKPSAKRRKA